MPHCPLRDLGRLLWRIQPDTEESSLLVLGALMLFCVTASGAGAQDRIAASTSLHRGIVKLPVVDKQDIRFTQLSIHGEPFQAEIQSITQDKYGFLWFGTDGRTVSLRRIQS